MKPPGARSSTPATPTSRTRRSPPSRLICTGQGYEYYWKTHVSPCSTFKYTMSSLLDLMAWDATDQVELIDAPLLMIAGSAADTRYMSDDAFPKATGTDDKELFIIDGAPAHRDLLDRQVRRRRARQANGVLRQDDLAGSRMTTFTVLVVSATGSIGRWSASILASENRRESPSEDVSTRGSVARSARRPEAGCSCPR